MSDAEFIPQEGPKAFVAVWRKVILDPRGFYRDLPATGGFENPLIFLGICGLFYFLLTVIVAGLTDAVNALFLVALAYIFGPAILIVAAFQIFLQDLFHRLEAWFI